MLNPRLGRRRAVLGLAASCAISQARAAPASPLSEGASLLVAGPPGGRTDRWADLLSPSLNRLLNPGATITRINAGGADGVTGANQFEARAVPDGATALLAPGQAALPWLAGDPRVHFDAARWVPIWAGAVPAALACRTELVRGRPLRVAVTSMAGPDLAALLTLELMGIEAVPVPAALDADAVFARPDIDVALLCGPALRTDSTALSAHGMQLVLTLGALSASGQTVRDPAFPNLPTAPEAIAQLRPDAPQGLMGALRSVSAAVQLDVALVLPRLSPAAVVAQWRKACAALSQAPEVQAEAARTGTRLASGPSVALLMAAVAADVPTLLDLRQWLGTRYNYAPS